MGTRECFRLISEQTGRTVVEELRIADGLLGRSAGLVLRRRLTPGEGLLLVPCGSVHTFFVRFALDLIFLDTRGTVVQVRRDVQPWRTVSPMMTAHAVLEMSAGAACVQPGEILRIRPAGSVSTPPRKSVAFLFGDC